eukprot:7462855-Pyramimonas_sp.AAC.1
MQDEVMSPMEPRWLPAGSPVIGPHSGRYVYTREVRTNNTTSFYGSSCADNGEGALDTPDC